MLHDDQGIIIRKGLEIGKGERWGARVSLSGLKDFYVIFSFRQSKDGLYPMVGMGAISQVTPF